MKTNVIEAGGILSTLSVQGMEKRLSNLPSVSKIRVIS